jgi:hypothetical protein
MPAPIENQFWRARSSHGRKLLFESPEKLWEACCEYFEWVEDNPLSEEKLFASQGEITRVQASKMRAMTLAGLSTFLGIGEQTWRDYRVRKDFSEVISKVESIIWDQKFSGAAAGILNANIIARDLGLSEKTETINRLLLEQIETVLGMSTEELVAELGHDS